MKDPVHPGKIVRHDCLEALGLSVTDAAAALGVSRPSLSKLINGRSAVSPEMAIRLAEAFGSRPEIWLKMQLYYDLAQARRRAKRIKVKRYKNEVYGIHDKPQ
jgi:addiction module HigA family antidote